MENNNPKDEQEEAITYDPGDGRISLEECRKILNTEGDFYTDEEIIIARDWLYIFADMTLEEMD